MTDMNTQPMMFQPVHISQIPKAQRRRYIEIRLRDHFPTVFNFVHAFIMIVLAVGGFVMQGVIQKDLSNNVLALNITDYYGGYWGGVSFLICAFAAIFFYFKRTFHSYMAVILTQAVFGSIGFSGYTAFNLRFVISDSTCTYIPAYCYHGETWMWTVLVCLGALGTKATIAYILLMGYRANGGFTPNALQIMNELARDQQSGSNQGYTPSTYGNRLEYPTKA